MQEQQGRRTMIKDIFNIKKNPSQNKRKNPPILYCCPPNIHTHANNRKLLVNPDITASSIRSNVNTLYFQAQPPQRLAPSKISTASFQPLLSATLTTFLPSSSTTLRSGTALFTSSLKTSSSPFSTACIIPFQPR